ncbi:urea ABC transporter substrate-binding protein [Aeromicrobium flavum]|uniref:urea ABC transporter substrate-binding protein n=1 Tax=Aeromicrobium flavum TaxID=416568 RepID=UPI0031D70803
MTSRKLLSSTAAAVAATLVLTGCGTKSSEGDDAAAAGCVDTSGDSVKLGFLNSLSGTMAISEVTVSNSLKLAAEEINAGGGILGKKIEIVQEDGASEPDIFAEKAKKLIQDDCVAAVFGGWTSSSRKAMLPVFESLDNLLFYPVQYEGLEASDNIFYTGATTNQQILPGLDYLKNEKKIKTLFLVGSDYVFPRTANDEIKQWAAANDVKILGEEYQPLGEAEWGPAIDKITRAKPDAVFNTINGDSNVAFFKAYFDKGLSKTPVISVSIAEEEVAAMGADLLEGQLTAWNYYQTLDNPANKTFVAAFKKKYGKDKPTSDPMEAAYTSLYLYKAMVEKAESFAVADIQEAADGVTFEAPEGLVTVDGDNHHITKTGRIGEVQPNGLIDTVWESDAPIDPDPFLEDYDWYEKTS